MDITTPPRVPAQLVQLHYPNGKPAGQSRELHCPYCGQTHWHGSALGHRSAHCTDYVRKRRQKVDPRDVQRTPGYVLCDPSEAIPWQAEALRAQFVVLRNERRRLAAEQEAMMPLGAREKRVKADMAERVSDLTTLLNRAGVSL